MKTRYKFLIGIVIFLVLGLFATVNNGGLDSWTSNEPLPPYNGSLAIGSLLEEEPVQEWVNPCNISQELDEWVEVPADENCLPIQ